MLQKIGSEMKKISILFLGFGLCVSCGGPKLFKKPEDFVGGNVEGVNNRYEELLVLESEGLVTIDEPE